MADATQFWFGEEDSQHGMVRGIWSCVNLFSIQVANRIVPLISDLYGTAFIDG